MGFLQGKWSITEEKKSFLFVCLFVCLFGGFFFLGGGRDSLIARPAKRTFDLFVAKENVYNFR